MSVEEFDQILQELWEDHEQEEKSIYKTVKELPPVVKLTDYNVTFLNSNWDLKDVVFKIGAIFSPSKLSRGMS